MDIRRVLWQVAEAGFAALTRFAVSNGLILYFSKPDTPAAPDYTGAAKAEGQASIEAAVANAILNRSNQYTPYGSQTWEMTPGSPPQPGGTSAPTGSQSALAAKFGLGTTPGAPGATTGGIPQFTSRITLSPEGQQLFDADMRQKLGLSGLADTSIGQVGSALSTPLDLSASRPDYNQKVADALYGRATRYLDPQWEQYESDERTRLANAGFSMQNEGYGSAIDDFSRRRDSAYGTARDTATAMGESVGTTQRQQDISELLLQRQQPLTELNALRTGAQPGVPSFPSTNVGANAQGADLLGATQAQGQAANDIYGSQVGSYNSTVNTAGQIGTMALLGYLGLLT